ncbi:MAG: hypothetical protein H6602_07630 [Flavobacteriales bacterium]|nr:hypothetical protein [Flavobacteriales bacterium]
MNDIAGAEHSKFFILEIIMFAILMIPCIIWQFKLHRKDVRRKGSISVWIPLPTRVVFSIATGLLIVFGVIIYGLIRVVSETYVDYSPSLWMADIAIVCTATLISAVKSKLGPIVTGITVCSAIYYYLELNQFHIFSLTSVVFDVFSVNWPKTLANSYTLLVTVIAIAGAIYDSSVPDIGN